ncbi:MAG: DNA translocase FtsK, partial [Miltoncostaeaceae bacterium]
LPPSPALRDPHLRPEDTLPPEPADRRESPDDEHENADDLEPAIAPLVAAPEPTLPPAPAATDDEPAEWEAPADGEWRAPSTALLRRSSGPAEISPDQVKTTSEQLEEALGHFGIEAQVANAIGGPRVTRYELRLKPGTKVGRISALRDDLAYALAARDELRIIAPIPGKQAVGVEVPNPEPALVTLGDIYRDFPKDAGPLMAWLGLDIGGKPVYVDLTRMPHLLIAGSTGTGKSVCLNALLASILLRSSPDELKMILVDPKKVELNHYESLPHLVTPVVTRPNDAAAVLGNVVREMEARYELMGMARARNLNDWNDIRETQGEKAIPTMLVVIDELADLMMIAPAEVEDSIIRLAQKSRAVGIHLVLATQRPSADVITGMIKANVPSRIAFAVSSQVDSRVILDANGAESLLGQGDMLFRPVGSSRLQRLQGAYVSEEEIRLLADAWRDQGRPEIREELLERPEEDPAADEADEEVDAMLHEAVELVVSQGTASVSMLQRRLGVGYARAGRLVDTLERMGVVSGYEGSKPRRVLVGPGDLPRLLGRPDDEHEAGDPDGAGEGDEMPGDLQGSAPLG